MVRPCAPAPTRCHSARALYSALRPVATSGCHALPAAHFAASRASSGVFTALAGGAAGARFSLAEAQALQDRAQRELRLCKPRLNSQLYHNLDSVLTGNQAAICELADAYPGQDMLPAQRRVSLQSQEREAMECSGCRQAAYCSRECQARHWKEGGHMRECAQLAAAAGAGSSTAAAP